MLIEVEVERTDRFTREVRVERSYLKIVKDEAGTHVRLIGGETGFEGFSVPPYRKLQIDDWLACAGRPMEYDQLLIRKGEMRRAFAAAGLVPLSLEDYEEIFDTAAEEAAVIDAGETSEELASDELRNAIVALHKIFDGKLKK